MNASMLQVGPCSVDQHTTNLALSERIVYKYQTAIRMRRSLAVRSSRTTMHDAYTTSSTAVRTPVTFSTYRYPDTSDVRGTTTLL